MSILFLICDQTGEGEGKWQRIDDIEELDEDGFVYITDRKKDMIVTGGNNVYPRQIEEIIYQNKEIEEACIVGIPDKLWGGKLLFLLLFSVPDKQRQKMK